MTMAFIATSDAHGECDSSFRAGPAGFMRVIDEKTVMWPEYKGNGVMASMGNISENGYVGILFVDFFESAVGLHVNGTATVVENAAVEAFAPLFDRLPFATAPATSEDVKKTPERWVVVSIDEAYIHCSKHIPMLQPVPEDEETGRRAGDVFKAKQGDRPWLQPTCEIEEPVIGDVKFADEPAPTHAASGRRLPLPVRK
jgi:predicted pyridoxine 5'-phosphate oxidase superfamily flavin-nucleotide-binding protein